MIPMTLDYLLTDCISKHKNFENEALWHEYIQGQIQDYIDHAYPDNTNIAILDDTRTFIFQCITKSKFIEKYN